MAARAASAQGVPAQPTLPSLDAKADQGQAKPYADDERSGHVLIRAESGLDVPFGQVQSGGTISDAAPFGLAIGGSVGVGISRYAEIDATGAFTLLSGRCDSCSATSVAASLGLVYHLAQGTSLDPFIRFGMGYRTLEVDYDPVEAGRFRNLPAGRYHGLDAAKVTLGASYLPVRGFGVGPWLSFGVGTMLAGPEPIDGRRAYGLFQLGIRLEIDPVGWASPSSPARAAGGPATSFPAGPPSL